MSWKTPGSALAVTAVALAVGLGLGGCGLLSQDCTLIGCDNLLVVSFDQPVPEGATVTAIPAGGAGRVRKCVEAAGCDLLGFRGFTPRQVTVTLAVGEVFVARSYEPVYRGVYPNGEACGPACRQGEVLIPWVEAGP